jgi:UDP-2-acetamido-3-amino-2,3-dideoxy-glucuronate N-acetyltransferase
MTKIHSHALVETADIGEGTAIWAFAHVMSGVQIGSHCNIGDHTFLETGSRIGNNVTIKNQVTIWEGIVIEDDCFIGPRVTFTNDRFPRSPRMPAVANRYSDKKNWLCPTVVRRGCSIGAAVVICPGIELGAYSQIAAGAVVTKNVAPFSMVRGNPARHCQSVCACGQLLIGDWREALCQHCGQSGCSRQQLLNLGNLQLPEIEPQIIANQHRL